MQLGRGKINTQNHDTKPCFWASTILKFVWKFKVAYELRMPRKTFHCVPPPHQVMYDKVMSSFKRIFHFKRIHVKIFCKVTFYKILLQVFTGKLPMSRTPLIRHLTDWWHGRNVKKAIQYCTVFIRLLYKETFLQQNKRFMVNIQCIKIIMHYIIK